ncbi:DUF2126 domain-containing protein [Panacagrimonas sp.]|uniref:transglutaminase family protein n=1 Tax=Panacagrimonas sp. TaxID=2480088 RepID=UPI003B516C08
MPLHAALFHQTVYRYDRRVTLSPQIIRLRPAPHSRTRVLSYSLRVEPQPHFINWQQDAFANWQARVVFPEAVDHFTVTVDLVADMAVYDPFDFFVAPEAEFFPFEYVPGLRQDLEPYLRKEAATPRFKAMLDKVDLHRERAVDFLVELNRRVQQRVKYLIRMEPGVQTPEETLVNGSGSCRDSAWLLVQLLRHLGLAARFCSGYLIQLTPDVKSLDGPSGTDHDFTDLHAWCEVYLPGAGWVGLDPTSGLLTGEGHVPLCATPEPSSAAPITGTMSFAGKGELKTEFGHEMKVTRLLETARVTKPYSDEQWSQIDALGDAVDTRLKAGDVRLTMGGEPTFISIDDMQGAEWNTAAVGPMKEGLARELIYRLRDRFAPGGLLTFGQGKWYPGESLPRWAYSLYWRGDGTPIVHGDLADGSMRADADSARALIRGIAERLEIDPDNAVPAYEDAFYYLHRERKLPDNVTPEDSKLKNAEERARLARVFSRGLDTPKGYALPVQRWQSRALSQQWISERWTFRGGRMYLIPGDSPVGFRLPLETLPWVPPLAYPHLVPYDPFARRDPLPSNIDPRRQPFLQAPVTEQEQRRRERQQKLTAERDQPTPERRGAYLQGGNVRTALAVEPRDGQLCVFMPPVETIEDYLDLITAVEDSAAEFDVPVRVEGYPPPADSRLNVLRVTPDPGVIEVNVHPAHSWTQLREITLEIYEQARLSRLGTEKFLIDGRAVGTGGGNHIVVGAATPADSPFLRRPDLLASMIRYWQNHPALSYLFSGLFIGPTSQHPRPDEGRDTALYELEIALAQLPPAGVGSDQAGFPLWLVDRLFRNILIDITGNTHRTELSIDKLYSPDGPTGRLGLLEIRSFEMPPHARMSLVQQLLVRAMICAFWEKPYTAPLIRWGTRLHDEFMLPHFVWKDFCEVLRDLQSWDYPFRPEWFEPHLEFRFPLHGTLQHQSIELELRHALEPWPVLGEEGAVGGTTRFVDSSLERLQVKARGLVPGKHFVTVGGRRLPLRATGVRDEFVCGLRYRAWKPTSALHPTIGVHTPLVFDLYDAQHRRALAGCTYHVMHPAGRNYETFPINSYEAESRRLSRFEPGGHTPSAYWPPTEMPNPEYPCTLDLRRPSGL